MEPRKQIARAFRRRGRSLLWLAWLLVVAVPAAGTERKVLQKSLADPQVRAKDAWLDQGSPNANHGADTTLRVQSFSGQNQRAIVMIDLSSIPRSAIKAATLTLFMSTAPTSNESYIAERILSFWTEPDATWNNRLPSSTPWGVAGGDSTSTGSATLGTGTTSGVPLNWVITRIVQRYFSSVDSSGMPVGNYGFIIKDSTENSLAQLFAIFSSKEDATAANRPSLTVDFIQQVTGLTAVPGNAQVTLNWSYPATVGAVINATTGVLILRQASSPIGPNDVPTDGSVPALCSSVGTGTATVILVDATLATSFVDNAVNDACGAPANGTTYYYRVFTRDSANNWSASTPPVVGGAAANVPEIMATPGATAATQQAAAWMLPTGATSLAAPGIDPGMAAIVGSNTNLLQGVNPGTGADVLAPASTGGVISGRPPALRAADDSLVRPATYVANQDNFVYAIDSGPGEIVWLANPNGLTTNNFVGGAAVLVKSFATAAYTLLQDLVVVGTHNTGSPTTNQILGLNGNTGATVWSVIGGTSGSVSCGGVCNMDIVNSTPAVDYVNNAIWVTTQNNNTPAGTPNRPNLWKLDANTGAILGAVNLGGNITSSPTLPRDTAFVLVGTDSGSLFAINPATLATVATFTPTPVDGPVKGFPVLASKASPFTVVFSTNGNVNAVTFDGATFSFLWKTPITAPSTPITSTDLTTVYVGSGDGKLHELALATGVDGKQRIVDTAGATVGDPSLDLFQSCGGLNCVIAGSTDGRVYAFTFPF